MAFSPNAEILFLNTPCAASKVLPCQANRLTAAAILGLKGVPDATIAVPSVGPSGIGPAGLFVKSSSSCSWLISNSLWTSIAIYTSDEEAHISNAPLLHTPWNRQSTRFSYVRPVFVHRRE